jgi:putative flavoprotein involved in K+ transport
MARQQTEALIVGGGQAGMVMSHMLSRRRISHVVLERARIAERWRSERWDGLRFQFPNWSLGLPDFPFRHADPDGFATVGEIADYLDAYAAFVAPPIRCGVEVMRVRLDDRASGFVAETSDGSIEASNIVVATGPYQRPVFPALPPDDGVVRLHASAYRAPEQLPRGAVLIVGSGASGAQIAEELAHAGRRVFLSVGRHKRMPRRYRGRDLMWWLNTLGLDQTPVERRGPDTALPLITGAYGGHTIDFRNFAAQGITLLGHLASAQDGVLIFAPDLADSIAHGDAAYHAFLDMVDAHVERQRLDLPSDPGARAKVPDARCLVEPVARLDLRAEGISAIICATGYAFDFSWIDVPVLDARGQPVHERGVSAVPGLYFLGLPWLSKMNSSFLVGVGDDARYLAEQIVRHGSEASVPLDLSGADLHLSQH